jgi:hypothetical protein
MKSICSEGDWVDFFFCPKMTSQRLHTNGTNRNRSRLPVIQFKVEKDKKHKENYEIGF